MKMIKRLAALCMTALTVLAVLQLRPLALQSLQVGVCPDTPPYQFQDDNGRLTGMHIDFLNYIGYLKGYQMDYVSFQRVSDAVTALEKGEIDVVLGALPGDVLNNGRVQFTDPLSSSSVCMVVPKEMEAEISGSRNKVSRFSSAFELGTITFSHLSQFWLKRCRAARQTLRCVSRTACCICWNRKGSATIIPSFTKELPTWSICCWCDPPTGPCGAFWMTPS